MKARLSGDNVRRLNALVEASRREVARFYEHHDEDDDFPGPVIRNVEDALQYCIAAATREVYEDQAEDNDAYQAARTAAWEAKKEASAQNPSRPGRQRVRPVPTAPRRAANAGPKAEPVTYAHAGRDKGPAKAGRRRGGGRSSSTSSTSSTPAGEGASE